MVFSSELGKTVHSQKNWGSVELSNEAKTESVNLKKLYNGGIYKTREKCEVLKENDAYIIF